MPSYPADSWPLLFTTARSKAMSSGLDAPVFSTVLGLFGVGGGLGSGTSRPSRRSLFNAAPAGAHQSSPFRVAASSSAGVAGAARSPRLSMGNRSSSGQAFTSHSGAHHAQIAALAAAVSSPGSTYGAVASTAGAAAAAAGGSGGGGGGTNTGTGYRPRLSSPNFTALDDELLAAARWSAARLEQQHHNQQQHGQHHLQQGRLSPAYGGGAAPHHPSPLSAGASSHHHPPGGAGHSPAHSQTTVAAHPHGNSPASPLLQHSGGGNYFSRIASARRSGACSSASLTPAGSMGLGPPSAALGSPPAGQQAAEGLGETMAPERSMCVISGGVLVVRGSSCGPIGLAAAAGGDSLPEGGGSGWRESGAVTAAGGTVSEAFELGMGEAAGVAGAPGHAPAGASAAAGVMASARDADASCSTRVDSSCSTVGGADERRGGPAWEVRQASQARQEQLVSEVSGGVLVWHARLQAMTNVAWAGTHAMGENTPRNTHSSHLRQVRTGQNCLMCICSLCTLCAACVTVGVIVAASRPCTQARRRRRTRQQRWRRQLQRRRRRQQPDRQHHHRSRGWRCRSWHVGWSGESNGDEVSTH